MYEYKQRSPCAVGDPGYSVLCGWLQAAPEVWHKNFIFVPKGFPR